MTPKRRAYLSAYYEKNAEVLVARSRANYRKNAHAINAKRRQKYAEDPEQIKAEHRAYYQKHREARTAYQRARHKTHNDAISVRDAARKFGIEHEDVVALRRAFPECAICGNTDKNKRLAIDHDHDTGAVRGLLCSRCNTGLGHFRDSAELLLKALAYLERFRERRAS